MKIEPLSISGYRNFGLSFALVIAVLFGLVLPWLFGALQPLWPWQVAAVLVLWALLSPATLAIIYKSWMRFALVVGFINTRLLLGLVFFAVFVPIAGLFRLFRIDPLERKIFDPQSESYWKQSKKSDPKNLENMY